MNHGKEVVDTSPHRVRENSIQQLHICGSCLSNNIIQPLLPPFSTCQVAVALVELEEREVGTVETGHLIHHPEPETVAQGMLSNAPTNSSSTHNNTGSSSINNNPATQCGSEKNSSGTNNLSSNNNHTSNNLNHKRSEAVVDDSTDDEEEDDDAESRNSSRSDNPVSSTGFNGRILSLNPLSLSLNDSISLSSFLILFP